MPYTIETTNLTKKFGAFVAVKGINVQVEMGEIFGFLGPNGAGKTTAIRMLCGLLTPTSGSGRVAGFDIMKQTAKIRSRIGYMSQKFTLYTDLTVLDNMKLYGTLYGLGREALKRRIGEMASFLHLRDIMERMTGDLPWGWQQRLSLACANLHEPEILFLDEPTGSVDPLSRKNFWGLIAELSSRGTTIFVTTHHMDEAEYCGRVSLMVDGEIAEEGSPQELKQRSGCATLHEVFLKVSTRRLGSAVGQKGNT
jgi:ABC-2 type transport system ATP-binding protein